MADTRTNQTTWDLLASLREVNKAVTDSTIEAQQRNVAFAQSILENGIELLKSHAEDTRSLLQDLLARTKDPQNWQSSLQEVIENAIAVQERNTKFIQSVFENGIEVLKSQLGVTRALLQEMEQQEQKQQDAFQTLAHESFEAYLGFVRAPFSYYQQAFEAAELATREGLENFQKATRQGVERIQKAAKQAQNAASKASK
jgi:predicted secreted protein